MSTPETSISDDSSGAGRALDGAPLSPPGAQPGDASASPASCEDVRSRNVREEGKEGSRETLGPDGFPVADARDISFDPQKLSGAGFPNNIPAPKPISGGEDWLTVNFYVNHHGFEALAKRLDDAQELAAKGIIGCDEIQFGDLRFIVAARGVRQGSGAKSIHMRWRLLAENGLTVLMLNRGEAHEAVPNVSIRATSFILMRYGLQRVWDSMQYCIEAMGGEIVANKVSRVDACVDLPGVDVSEFVTPFSNHWIVSRSRLRANYGVGTFINEYLSSKRSTGFTVGRSPLLCRVYDKLTECRRDFEKLAVMEAMRWGGIPECASRVEFLIARAKLKDFGINSVADWIDKRADVIEELMTNWLRLTDGPVDRKHADRTPIHPVWQKAREAFAWCGEPLGKELVPLPKLEVRSSRQIALIIGIFKGMFARVGKDIRDNEHFFREAEFAIRDVVGERDMACEVHRKALELGIGGVL